MREEYKMCGESLALLSYIRTVLLYRAGKTRAFAVIAGLLLARRAPKYVFISHIFIVAQWPDFSCRRFQTPAPTQPFFYSS